MSAQDDMVPGRRDLSLERVRRDLVRHLMEQIMAGTYATPGKFEVVADKLVAELRGEEDDEREQRDA